MEECNSPGAQSRLKRISRTKAVTDGFCHTKSPFEEMPGLKFESLCNFCGGVSKTPPFFTLKRISAYINKPYAKYLFETSMNIIVWS